MPPREVIAPCRICPGVCSLRFTFDKNEKIVSVRGDKSNPVTRGYACIKGLQWHEFHAHPDRLQHSLKRQPDGSFKRITLDDALDEIAAKLQGIIKSHGAESIAAFRGTAAYLNVPTFHMQPSWLASIGSNSFYSTMTIDQSAKWVVPERLGSWAAGHDAIQIADVCLIVGSNPLVAVTTTSFYMQDPLKNLKDAKKRGLKLIVIDPRETETAKHADIFLQPLPGEDVTVLSGILHIIFRQSWHDTEFCRRYVKDLDRLIKIVEPFTPEYVARRAKIDVDSLYAVASAFGEPLMDESGIKRLKRGAATSATGPSMGPHSSLAEHLLECLNVVCGRFARPGDKVFNPGVVSPRNPRVAKVNPPRRSWESGWQSRIGGYGMLFGEKPSGILAQEITTPGPGQIRALIVSGGNPANAMPDSERVIEAFGKLDLLVAVEPFMTHTAKLSHYIIPPKLMLEIPTMPNRDLESTIMPTHPYGQYAAPVLKTPEGSELADDWFVYWALARRMNIPVIFDGVPLDMDTAPATEHLLAIIARHSAVPLEELKRYPEGKLFDVEPMVVKAAPERDMGRFDVAPLDIEEEVKEVYEEEYQRKGFTHLLSVRRLRDVTNTSFHNLPKIRRSRPYNPAFVHPDDLARLGVASDEQITIASKYGRVKAIAKADESLCPGVVNLPHGWGPLPGEEPDPHTSGANVNLLTTSCENRDRITAMPVMTGIPVNIFAG